MSTLPVFGFHMLLNPWALLLLLAVAALLVAELSARAPGAMLFSTGATVARIKETRSALIRRIPALLRAAGLCFLVFALARPVNSLTPVKSPAEVIDIMLCVDVSGSMKAKDFMEGGELRDRLYVTKMAVRDFIKSRKQKESARYGSDRLGLVLYGGYAWTQCPLTLDYAVLERELDRAFVDDSTEIKQKTAIGSAIGLAVSRLRNSEAKSKIIILLTDGVNNAGEIDPKTAAQLAKEYGIRIYTIGAGSKGEALIEQQTLFGPRLSWAPIPIDEDTLKEIARIADGRFYRATDTETLHEAYNEINQLERTEIEAESYYDYEDAFVPYALLGTMAVTLSVFTRRLWFDPIP